MVKHLFPNFLQDERVYVQVERFWLDLWQQLDPDERVSHGWIHPWFEPLPPSISEGNPIFSAVSTSLRRGVRILQYEPTDKSLEFYAYPDSFGGSIFEPQTIHELVISCALSDVAAKYSKQLMLPWIQGRPISLDLSEAGLITSNFHKIEMSFDDYICPAA